MSWPKSQLSRYASPSTAVLSVIQNGPASMDDSVDELRAKRARTKAPNVELRAQSRIAPPTSYLRIVDVSILL
jgi:hypothetical protein